MKRWLIVLVIVALATTFLNAYAAQVDVGNGWVKINTEGETVCADGSPYNFWAHEGTSDDLLIFFQGGGACWNDAMCADGGGISYVETIGESLEYPMAAPGVFDFANPENPFKDYNVVSIPYCTGDIHMGSQDVEYTGRDGAVTIHHQGFTNASAALDWVYENYTAPEDVFVSGCSAGGYGAIFHAPRVIEQYGDTAATITHLSDASIGVLPDESYFDGFNVWGIGENIPDWLPMQEALQSNFNPVDYYTAVAQQYPEHTFGEYTTAYDNVQVLFYHLQKLADWSAGIGTLLIERGKAEEVSEAGWSAGMNERLDTINAAVENFSTFIAGGTEHCILDRDFMYTYEADETRFVDWLAELAKGEPVADVACSACEEAELAAQ